MSGREWRAATGAHEETGDAQAGGAISRSVRPGLWDVDAWVDLERPSERSMTESGATSAEDARRVVEEWLDRREHQAQTEAGKDVTT